MFTTMMAHVARLRSRSAALTFFFAGEDDVSRPEGMQISGHVFPHL